MTSLTYVTHNTEDIDINGTCLQGEVLASYQELCSLFGEPTDGDSHKTDAEWMVRFADGTVASIYNYKDGHAYCGEHGTPVREITDWHVGGMSVKALQNVKMMLELVREQDGSDDKFKAMYEDAEAILESVRMKFGQEFRDAVVFAYRIHKMSELFNLLIRISDESGTVPRPVCKKMIEVACELSAAMLTDYTKATGVVPEVEDAKRLMEWCDRLLAAEDAGVDSILRDIKSKVGKK
jgi:hypothetical protein